jgi:hypothetical protein
MPKFMFLQFVDESKAPRPGTPQMDAEVNAYGQLLQEANTAGILRGGDPCQPSAASFSVQLKDGRPATTDGSTVSGSRWLNGYWVFDCKDRDDAVQWAAKIPAADGGTVEVHPIFEM